MRTVITDFGKLFKRDAQLWASCVIDEYLKGKDIAVKYDDLAEFLKKSDLALADEKEQFIFTVEDIIDEVSGRIEIFATSLSIIGVYEDGKLTTLPELWFNFRAELGWGSELRFSLVEVDTE